MKFVHFNSWIAEWHGVDRKGTSKQFQVLSVSSCEGGKQQTQ